MRGTLCPWAGAVSFAASDLALLAGPASAARLSGQRHRPALCRSTRKRAGATDWRSSSARAFWRTSWTTRRGRGSSRRGTEQLATLGSEIRASPVSRRWRSWRTAVREVQVALAPGVAGRDAELRGVGRARRWTGTPRGRALLDALVRRGRATSGEGLTWVGPHRDDVAVRLGRADARTAASRGEQRTRCWRFACRARSVARRRHGDGPVLAGRRPPELDREVGAACSAWLERPGRRSSTPRRTPSRARARRPGPPGRSPRAASSRATP